MLGYPTLGCPPFTEESVVCERVAAPVGLLSAVLEKDDVGDIVDNIRELFRIDLAALECRRFRIELRTAVAKSFLFRVVIVILRSIVLLPVVAIRFARAFRSVTAIPGLTGFREDPLPDGLD